MEPDLHHAKIFATVDGLIAQWDEGATALFGYTADEAVGQSLNLIIPPDDRERHWKAYNRAMVTDGIWSNAVGRAVPTLPKGGGEITRAVRLMVIPDSKDKPIGALAVFSPLDTAPA